MSFEIFDRKLLKHYPLSERKNRVCIERDAVYPDAKPTAFPVEYMTVLRETAARIRNARDKGRSVVMAFGAHTIKNCLAPVIIHMMQKGWVTHLATNGAGVIHDWEIAYQGQTSENVAENVSCGKFGMWEETGLFINLAIAVGGWKGLGYGESVGVMIEREGLDIPDAGDLDAELRTCASDNPDRAGAAADLLAVISCTGVRSGWLSIPHPFKRYSIQAAAFRLGIPFTSHPMIGHDIIYTHPANHGGAVGRTALRDFLMFANSISNIDGGVYLSIGSAVMSPMIFEKSLSMAQNIAVREGRKIERHFIVVVDLAKTSWNWSEGEPPADNPAYYVRFCKSFIRMGGMMRYVCASNRDFLLALVRELEKRTTRAT